MGRETGLARCVWKEDGWLYLAGGGLVPPLTLEGPTEAPSEPVQPTIRLFDTPTLPPEFQWLRSPFPERLFILTGASLRLHGRESPGSWFEQALVARRQEHPVYRAVTDLQADPGNWQQAAGLTTYYNRHKFHAALLTREAGMRVLTLMSCAGDWPGERLSFPLSQPQTVPDGPIRLEIRVERARQRFWWGQPGDALQPLGPELDASVISDEGGRGEHANFTGAFVGMIAFDLTGQGRAADFTRFEYHPAA